MFEFGDKFRGKYDESVEAVKSYYASVSGYMDELLWGAMWLSKATDNDKYLQYVINNADNFGGIGWAITEFSWDVKYAGLQVMASKVKFFFFFFLAFFFSNLAWTYHLWVCQFSTTFCFSYFLLSFFGDL